jgi:hypothetical protein
MTLYRGTYWVGTEQKFTRWKQCRNEVILDMIGLESTFIIEMREFCVSH